MADFTFEIIKHLGTISNRTTNAGEVWTKEVNVVSWNGNKPKINIREWSEDHVRMSKGITLTAEEAEKLATILRDGVERSK